jgi:hypothetical protein
MPCTALHCTNQEKKGKVVIRQKKKEKKSKLGGGATYAGLGAVELDVAALLNSPPPSSSSSSSSSSAHTPRCLSYPLTKCIIPNSLVYFHAEAKPLEEVGWGCPALCV